LLTVLHVVLRHTCILVVSNTYVRYLLDKRPKYCETTFIHFLWILSYSMSDSGHNVREMTHTLSKFSWGCEFVDTKYD